MEVDYTDTAKRDIEYWKKSGDKAMMKKIQEIISDIQAHPETGIGKPEKLRYDLSGYWSRRINQEHRIVYKVSDVILISSLRGHYNK